MDGSPEPAGCDSDVGSPHWLVLEVPLVEEGVVEHQPSSDGDHREDVDRGNDAEPEAGDDKLAQNWRAVRKMKAVLDAFHFDEDSAPEKYSSDEVCHCQVEEHLVSSLSPKFWIPEEQVTEKEVGENDENGANNHKGGPW